MSCEEDERSVFVIVMLFGLAKTGVVKSVTRPSSRGSTGRWWLFELSDEADEPLTTIMGFR